jgi:hypothetical protein
LDAAVHALLGFGTGALQFDMQSRCKIVLILLILLVLTLSLLADASNVVEVTSLPFCLVLVFNGLNGGTLSTKSQGDDRPLQRKRFLKPSLPSLLNIAIICQVSMAI